MTKKREKREDGPREVAAKVELTGLQRKYLRGLVHGSHALVQVGRGGITNAVIDAIDDALEDHELIKVRMHDPEDKRALSRELAQRSGAILCGTIGHQAILYRPHPEKPRIKLPRQSS